MWRVPQTERSDFLEIYCSKCKELCEAVRTPSRSFIRECPICNNFLRFFRCKRTTCGSYESICPNFCDKYINQKSKKSKEIPYGWNYSINNSQSNSCLLATSIVGIALVITACLYYNYTKNLGNENNYIVNKLRRDYPSQKNETWYHFLSILDKEVPSVKSITLLHSKDKRTSNCLVKELVHLYTKNKSLKSEDITFSDFDADDYGFVLQHYQTVVKKFRVFVTDLNKVSGNVARIFHSLCDEVSSEIKPSLFIFTIKYDDKNKTLKPVEKATSVLRKAWNQLPDNELFPLLSRIVKNVVDIVPEHQINC